MVLNCFLWPDRAIGKKESREIREAHNATVDLAVQLRDALKACRDLLDDSDIRHFIGTEKDEYGEVVTPAVKGYVAEAEYLGDAIVFGVDRIG